jgi:hypothetical protein
VGGSPFAVRSSPRCSPGSEAPVTDMLSDEQPAEPAMEFAAGSDDTGSEVGSTRSLMATHSANGAGTAQISYIDADTTSFPLIPTQTTNGHKRKLVDSQQGLPQLLLELPTEVGVDTGVDCTADSSGSKSFRQRGSTRPPLSPLTLASPHANHALADVDAAEHSTGGTDGSAHFTRAAARKFNHSKPDHTPRGGLALAHQ